MSNVSGIIKSIQDIMRKDVGVDGDAQRISQLVWMFFLKIFDDREAERELLEDEYTSPLPTHLRWRNWAADAEGETGEALMDFVNLQLFPTLKDKLQTHGPNGQRALVVRNVFEDAYNYMKSGTLMRQVINKINEIDFNSSDDRHTFGDIYEQILKDLQSAGNAGEFYTPRAITRFIVDMIDPKLDESVLDPACGTGGFLACTIDHKRNKYVKSAKDEETLQTTIHGVEKKSLPHFLCTTNMILHGIDTPTNIAHDNALVSPIKDHSWRRKIDVVLTNPPFGGMEEDGIESNFPKSFQTRETADLFLYLIIEFLRDGGRAGVVLPDGTLFGDGVKARLKERLLEECNLHTIVRLPNSVFRPYASIGTNLLFFEKGQRTEEIWFYEHLVPDGQKAYSKSKPIRQEHLQGCTDWWGGTAREGREETERAWKVTADEVRSRSYNLDIRNPHTAADDHGDPQELLAALTAAETETASLRDQLKAILAEALAR